MIRAQKLKSGFSAIGVFIGVTFLIGAWSIVNGMNRYMTDKFAGTLVGVNTFHLRRRPNVNFNVERSEEHTSELQSRLHLVCRLLLEKKKKNTNMYRKRMIYREMVHVCYM